MAGSRDDPVATWAGDQVKQKLFDKNGGSTAQMKGFGWEGGSGKWENWTNDVIERPFNVQRALQLESRRFNFRRLGGARFLVLVPDKLRAIQVPISVGSNEIKQLSLGA